MNKDPLLLQASFLVVRLTASKY